MEKKEQTEKEGIMMHFKPSYAFQCVEFDYFVTKDNMAEVADWLDIAVKLMMATAPEQPEQPKKQGKAFKPATDKQKALMDRYGIEYPTTCSVDQAGKLIKNYFDENGE